MRRTRGLHPRKGRVVWELTVPEARMLADHLERLVQLEGERDLAGHITHAAADLRFFAGAAQEMRSGNGFGDGLGLNDPEVLGVVR